MNRRVGIFGGTFDPVHYGHLRAALEVMHRLELPSLRLLPAGKPPHRAETAASAAHRLAMLRLALAGHTDLRADDREVRRAGYSYMVDTLQEIRHEEGRAALLLIVGQDAANELDSWHDWRRLFELAHIVIMRRPESAHRYSAALQQEIEPRTVGSPAELGIREAGCVLPLQVTQLAISSTHLRQMIARGESPRFLLPDPVIDYIERYCLYREC